MPTLTERQLIEFARNLLSAGGATPAEADIVADSLVQANLRGRTAPRCDAQGGP